MAITRVDELNQLQQSSQPNKKKKAIPIEEYFQDMDIPEEDKEKRISLADGLLKIFAMLFAMVESYQYLNQDVDYEDFKNKANLEVFDLLQTIGLDTQENGKIRLETSKFIGNIFDTNSKYPDDSYYTSSDRATEVSENLSNQVYNLDDYNTAIESGKTHKRWKAILDRSTRHTHRAINNVEVGIYDTFDVGDSEMMFPMDASYGASLKEIVNCRCSVEYF